MVYGKLRLQDRLVRTAIGALIGGGAAFLIMLRFDLFGLWRMHARASLLLPATLVGAVIGGFLAFRRKQS
jgi:hypothetical protein